MLHLCVGLALVPIADTQHHGLGAEPCRCRTTVYAVFAVMMHIRRWLQLSQEHRTLCPWPNKHKPRECQVIAV